LGKAIPEPKGLQEVEGLQGAMDQGELAGKRTG